MPATLVVQASTTTALKPHLLRGHGCPISLEAYVGVAITLQAKAVAFQSCTASSWHVPVTDDWLTQCCCQCNKDEAQVPTVMTFCLMQSMCHHHADVAGTYDWAGVLTLQPDPFQVWNISSLDSRTQRRALLWALGEHASGHLTTTIGMSIHARMLLQAGDGGLSVNGRVSVCEARDAAAPAPGSAGATQPGTEAAIDDEIKAIYPVPPDINNPAGYSWLEERLQTPAIPASPELPSPVQQAFATLARTFTDPKNQRILIIVAAVVAPLGLALCIAGIVGLYVRRKRRRQQKKAKEQAAKAAQASQTSGGADMQNGASALSAAQPDPSTMVQYLKAHETGYGSVCGAAGQAVLPPSCEPSADGTARNGLAAARTGMFNNLRSSLSGMASNVAAAIGIHRSTAGDAYEIRSPQEPIPAGTLHGPSLELHWPPTLRRREPTLPGASRRSIDTGPTLQTAPPASLASPVIVGGTAAAGGRQKHRAALQPARQQQQQGQHGIAAQWLARPQATAQGRTATYATADMQYVNASTVYQNPLANDGSIDGGDAFFFATGSTFFAPHEVANTASLMSQSRQQPAYGKPAPAPGRSSPRSPPARGD